MLKGYLILYSKFIFLVFNYIFEDRISLSSVQTLITALFSFCLYQDVLQQRFGNYLYHLFFHTISINVYSR